ncbi:MAG TPA: M28 family peptidase [Vicinamibacterales bacterium]|nr:M28 family peptidase [Vicinamibacterales bacterium]
MRRGAVLVAFGAALAMPLGACAAPAPQAPAQPAAAQPATAMKFNSARAWTDLQRQVAFGPRPSGTPALLKTRQYILDQLKAAGIRAQEQPFTAATPAGPVSMANVIATIPGRRPERIVLASHYDTKRAPFRFVGANDGASSTAAVLELGRALAASQPAFTIELLFLDGEEAVNWDWAGTDNTYGSRHYVQAAQKAGTLAAIKALVLLDMIGDRDLIIRRESYSTPWLVDAIWGAAARTGHMGTFVGELTTVEDDHVNFVRAGVPSVDVIDLDNPTWHTAQDDLEHVSQKSLQVVGDVILAALPTIEQRLGLAR